MLDGREAADAPDDVGDRRAEGRVVDAEALPLDEHDLRLRVDPQAGLLEDAIAAAGLADVDVVPRDRLRSDRLADEERGHDERQPAEHGRLPVGRAPAAHPGRDVVGLPER